MSKIIIAIIAIACVAAGMNFYLTKSAEKQYGTERLEKIEYEQKKELQRLGYEKLNE